MNLKGKVSIITGAGSGMGEATAKLFAKSGAKVIVADMNEEQIARVVNEIKANNGDAFGITCNVSNGEEIINLINKTIEHYGKLDILMNNAGIMDNFVPVAELEESLWDKVMNVNLKGPYLLCKEAINYFLNNNVAGNIINVASVGGLFGDRGGASYVASKHGLIGLTKNIASVYKDNNIRCNAIAPGGINTNIATTINHPSQVGMTTYSKNVAQGPIGNPEDIANLALYLASDEAKFINGTVIIADGGWTAA
ncbi:MAG: glucose 1-dehydrogenase [Oscillospiraceae bacterium]|nr:glucose 1-dehydrogenase [Oscillospiraceae bacterium]